MVLMKEIGTAHGFSRAMDGPLSGLVETGESGTIPGTRAGGAGCNKVRHSRAGICPDDVNLITSSYAPSTSRRDSTRSISGRMLNSLEMAWDSSKILTAFSRSPSRFLSRRASA